MQTKHFCLSLLFTVGAAFSSGEAWAIKKCQDADGKWHYGDVAVNACKKSKVTTLNDRGFIESEKGRPKTENELALEAEAKAKAEEEYRLEREAEEERIRILSVYETEEDIDRQRDNQMSTVETSIAVHETFINQLKLQNASLEKKTASQRGRLLEITQEKIATNITKMEESKKELLELAEQKKAVEERFEKEKELFRTLKAELSKN